jgi:hypothetical protein
MLAAAHGWRLLRRPRLAWLVLSGRERSCVQRTPKHMMAQRCVLVWHTWWWGRSDVGRGWDVAGCASAARNTPQQRIMTQHTVTTAVCAAVIEAASVSQPHSGMSVLLFRAHLLKPSTHHPAQQQQIDLGAWRRAPTAFNSLPSPPLNLTNHTPSQQPCRGR